LKLHQKPCAVLNVNGYYDPLLSFLDQATNQEFLSMANRNLLLQAATPEDLLALMMQPSND
jgi:predicted Rossmann-fold nucleotide-binding protein